MLDSLGRTKDADVVEMLIIGNPGEPVTPDQIAGIPGVATSAALGAVVKWFLSLVQKFLDKGVEKSGEKAAEWISGRLGRSAKDTGYAVSDRLQTVAEIAKSLEAKGWPKDLVQKTADELWDRSEVVAKRLSVKKRA